MRSWLIGVWLLTLLDDAIQFREVLSDLATLGQRDLVTLWRGVSDLDARTASGLFMDAMPVLVEEYSTVAGVATAEYYDAQLPASSYRAVPAPTPLVEQVEGSTRWALSALYRDSLSSPLDLMAGAFQRMIFQTSRDTVVLNSQFEPGTLWARYASGNACKFCQMLATRSDVYVSEAAATVVGATRWDYARNYKGQKTGTGVAGRESKSRRSRGEQAAGRRYHDNCKCLAVPVRAGSVYEPPSYVERWTDEYGAAYEAASKAAGFGVAASTKDILREWERLTRV